MANLGRERLGSVVHVRHYTDDQHQGAVVSEGGTLLHDNQVMASLGAPLFALFFERPFDPTLGGNPPQGGGNEVAIFNSQQARVEHFNAARAAVPR